MNKNLAAFDRGFASGVEHAQTMNHSCHDDCKLAGCVNRRLREGIAELNTRVNEVLKDTKDERDGLKAKLEKLKGAAEKVLGARNWNTHDSSRDELRQVLAELEP